MRDSACSPQWLTRCPLPSALLCTQVCFRVRPLDKRERAAGEPCAWEIDTRTHTLVRRSDSVRASGVVGNNGAASVRDSQQLSFPCSTLFDQEASTEQLYDVRCRDIVESAMRGVNGSVLVYGQTSSGKVSGKSSVCGTDGGMLSRAV